MTDGISAIHISQQLSTLKTFAACSTLVGTSFKECIFKNMSSCRQYNNPIALTLLLYPNAVRCSTVSAAKYGVLLASIIIIIYNYTEVSHCMFELSIAPFLLLYVHYHCLSVCVQRTLSLCCSSCVSVCVCNICFYTANFF